MHDPTTLAFRIKWLGVEVWHTDPTGDHGPPCWSKKSREPGGRRRFWRWHVHHWGVHFRPWSMLRRWALSRCNVCGRGFPLGYCPISTSWDRPPKRFLRGETHLRHHECSHLMSAKHTIDELKHAVLNACSDHVLRGGTRESFIETVATLEPGKIPEGMDWNAQWRVHYRLECLLGIQAERDRREREAQRASVTA